MRTLTPIALAALLIAGCGSEPAALPADPRAAGPELLARTVQMEDGTSATLATLTHDGPIVLYIIKEHCMANGRALPHVNKLYGYYGKKARFLAIANVAPERLKAWKKEFEVNFPVALDPDRRVIDALGIRYSQTAIVVNPDGTAGPRHDGYGLDSLTALNKTIAKVSNVPVPKIDWRGAPTVPSYG